MSLPHTIRRIVLVGFMGAGKSTVGALLAQKLGWEFLDADGVIESRTGMTIAGIFTQRGEPAFRALEAETIRDLLRGEHLVLSLGGGGIETVSTREVLRGADKTCVVFLEAPLETLVARCLAQPAAAERPVLADREGLLRRFNERLPHYRSAHLTVVTEKLTPEGVAAQILEAMERRYAPEAAAQGTSTR